MKIAVFISGFPVQAYLRDLLNIWVKEGHKVDLYKTAHRINTDTVDLLAWSVPVLEVETRDGFFRLLKALDRHLFSIIPGMPSLALPILTSRFARRLNGVVYDLFMGVEKVGLIVASALGKKMGISYIYYSLELYVEDHPYLTQLGYLRRAEQYANAGALATIIQDQRRAKVLEVANRLQGHNFIYLPVGVAEIQLANSYDADLDAMKIPTGQFIILFVGILTKQRRIQELIKIADILGEDEYLLLHGPDFQIDTIYNSGKKVLVSKTYLSEEKLDALVEKSGIGIALYFNHPLNERLTAFSSHKIALYLKHGKPIIVQKNESYEDLMTLYPCGEMIDNIEDLPAAVKKIRADYQFYSRQAVLAFNDFYNLKNNAPRVIQLIERLMNKP